MEKFTSITSFGGLTVNGQKLKFEDFDKNNDGMISETEYSEVVNVILPQRLH